MFKDKLLEQQIVEKGFSILPAIEENQLSYFRNIYDRLHNDKSNTGHISTAFSDDIAYKDNCNVLLKDFFNDIIGEYAYDFEIYGTSFVYKIPSKNSELGPHQDWTIIDESKYFSLNCWVPLCDVSVKNGTMYVLPGSHYIKHKSIRSPSLGYYYDNYRDVVLKYMIPMKVKAGTAVIIHHSIIHYSSPNLSSSIRKAIITAAKSKDAPTFLFYQNKDNQVLEKYLVNEDFALEYNDFFYDNKLKPNGLLCDSENFTEVKFKKKELENLFSNMLKDSKYFNSDFGIMINKVRNRLAII